VRSDEADPDDEWGNWLQNPIPDKIVAPIEQTLTPSQLDWGQANYLLTA
jgi:hypothetical protein